MQLIYHYSFIYYSMSWWGIWRCHYLAAILFWIPSIIYPPQKKLWGEFNVLRQYYLKIKNFRGEPHFKSKRIVLWLYNIPNTFSNRKLNQMVWKVRYFTTIYTCIHKISWSPFPIRKKNPEGVQYIAATKYLLTPLSILCDHIRSWNSSSLRNENQRNLGLEE